MDTNKLLEMTTGIVAAQAASGNTRNEAIPDLIASVYSALATFGAPPALPAPEPVIEKPTPAVSARKSLANPTIILSMIDGKPYKTLRRHISGHGYTPESYRETFGLPATYPMVAADYSETRRAMAKKFGLGRKPGKLAERRAH